MKPPATPSHDRRSPGRGTLALPLLILSSFSIRVPVVCAAEQDEPKPMKVAVVEKVTVPLSQVDVTVLGSEELARDLTASDFDLVVGGRSLDRFFVDGACRSPAVERAEDDSAREPIVEPAPARTPIRFVLYFDQSQLTVQGRERGIGLAERLLPRLVSSGNTVAVFSSARDLKRYTSFTGDLNALRLALDELRRDAAQFGDGPPNFEEARFENLLRGAREAEETGRATRYQADPDRLPIGSFASPVCIKIAQLATEAVHLYSEELIRSRSTFARLASVLQTLAGLKEPRALIYFGDTLRLNAGEHYWRALLDYPELRQLLGKKLDCVPMMSGWSRNGQAPEDALRSFDQLVREAAAAGIRVYSIQAEGLTSTSARRNRDAENALVSLALDTGGKAFLRGLEADKIAAAIDRDYSCYYLLSFDPTGFPEDRPLSVFVRMKRPQLKLQYRPRIVIQSESARRVSRLLTAQFVSPLEALRVPIHAAVIPLGERDGSFSGLLQVRVPARSIPGSTESRWQLGASVLKGGSVVRDFSREVTLRGSDSSIVLESSLELSGGAYEIASVAQELASEMLGASRTQGSWPSLKSKEPEVGEPVIVQPGWAIFVGDEAALKEGSIALDAGEAVRPDRPVAIVTLVCRGKGAGEALRADRKLVGETSVGFPNLDLTFGEERCAQLRDTIPATVLGEGHFSYEVVVVEGDREVARAERSFSVAAATPAP